MINITMEEKLKSGDALDVSIFPKNEDGDYLLPVTLNINNTDLCDAKIEKWIWSVGKRYSDGQILASLSTKLYSNPEFDCLWLR